MQTVAKSEFKARMLEIMRGIEATGEEIIVTDHGKPSIVVGPYVAKRDVRAVFGDLGGQLVLHEDPNLPTMSQWNEA